MAQVLISNLLRNHIDAIAPLSMPSQRRIEKLTMGRGQDDLQNGAALARSTIHSPTEVRRGTCADDCKDSSPHVALVMGPRWCTDWGVDC